MRTVNDGRVRSMAWSWADGFIMACGLAGIALKTMMPVWIAGVMVLASVSLIIMLMAIPVALAIMGKRYSDEERGMELSWRGMIPGAVLGVLLALVLSDENQLMRIVSGGLLAVGVAVSLGLLVKSIMELRREVLEEEDRVIREQTRADLGLPPVDDSSDPSYRRK